LKGLECREQEGFFKFEGFEKSEEFGVSSVGELFLSLKGLKSLKSLERLEEEFLIFYLRRTT
jgi:hypothetical protein